jgi:hypothetical protein
MKPDLGLIVMTEVNHHALSDATTDVAVRVRVVGIVESEQPKGFANGDRLKIDRVPPRLIERKWVDTEVRVTKTPCLA